MSTSTIYNSCQFISKAQTLLELGERLQLNISPVNIFQLSVWEQDKFFVTKNILDFANGKKLAVRSSCSDEDSTQTSAAGAFTSVLNVLPDSEAIANAVETVIASYGEHAKPTDEFFVQPMIENIIVSGVIMTRVLSDGSPYYVVNYDDESGKTDSITGGSRSGKTVFVYHGAEPASFDSPKLRSFVEFGRQVEQVCGRADLDIEFCLDADNVLHLLQVRPICTQNVWPTNIDNLVKNNIAYVVNYLDERFGSWPGLHGRTTILGVMPDWNPAEMIGFTPPLLSSSLYRELITRNVWRLARSHMGYKKLPPEELMLLLAGRPYIDVRVSFNSFLPEGLDNITAEVLVNAWLERLDQNPQLHDKVEFEIAQTALDFNFDSSLDERYPGLLTQPRREDFRRSLAILTSRCLDLGLGGSVQWAVNAVTELRNRQTMRTQVMTQNQGDKSQHLLGKLQLLLEECCLYGTLPFSILARHAFIATSLLRSALTREAIAPDRLAAFLQSIQTISGEMARDFQAVSQQNLSRETFLAKYGHLRPSSYDILSPRYLDRPDLFANAEKSRQMPEHEPFVFSQSEEANLNKLLAEAGLVADCKQLAAYARTVIAGREQAKFIFTRNLSDILEIIAIWGEGIGLSREDLSFLDVRSILDCSATALLEKRSSHFARLVDSGRDLLDLGRGLKLGYLLRSPRDVYVVPQHRSAPNFVGRGKITAPISCLTSSSACSTNISGHIVCIENADPGYDWIFTRDIAGLVTKFGGTNSHMAIRCAEYGLPAAIGVGDRLFEQIATARVCILDAADSQIRPEPE